MPVLTAHAGDGSPRPVNGSYRAIPFLVDAYRNLVVIRDRYGPCSGPYRRLVRHYRLVACELGCSSTFERRLRLLETSGLTPLT
jgi:hypothetical protein